MSTRALFKGEKRFTGESDSEFCDPERVRNYSTISLSFTNCLLLLLYKKNTRHLQKNVLSKSKAVNGIFPNFVCSVYPALLLAPHTTNYSLPAAKQAGPFIQIDTSFSLLG